MSTESTDELTSELTSELAGESTPGSVAVGPLSRPVIKPKRKAAKLPLATLIPLSLFWLALGFWIGATLAR
jgi:hypothetical protein